MSTKNLPTFSTQKDVITMRLTPQGLELLDQRALPERETWRMCTTLEDVADSIETLTVRGAPAIGGAAALGMVVVAFRTDAADVASLQKTLEAADARLRKTRPTAVNLFYALDKTASVWRQSYHDVDGLRAALWESAREVCTEDAERCRHIGEHGAGLFDGDARVLTICHTGALATCGIGTALGVLKTAHAQRREAGAGIGGALKVYALETRPLLQGARLTAWESMKAGLDVTLITDSMAAFCFVRHNITACIVGADRIARNGDTANKIGTYALAQLARAHGAKFYVAAPTSTIDATLATGAQIPIEERHPDEIRAPRGAIFAPADVPVWNPAFDVTPAELIDGIVTEVGVIRPPYDLAA